MSAEEIKRAIASAAPTLEFEVGSVPFQLVRISPGEFEMGSPATEAGRGENEGPARRIRIAEPFYLGRYEITQAQYKAVMGDNPSNVEGDSLPVQGITYAGAREFCDLLSRRIRVRVELPTEAQWEYACRAGTRTRYYSGDSAADLDKAAWYQENSGGVPHDVGKRQPNALGLYDMLGNVWEVCADYLESYDEMPATDPVGDEGGILSAMRGGGYTHGPEYCRCASRLKTNVRFGGMGLRIAIKQP